MRVIRPNLMRGALRQLIGLTVAASAASMIAPIQAQTNYSRTNSESTNYVTIYEECGFQGRSKSIDHGEYRRMRDIGFNNDAVSSVRVPPGLELIIYEDDKFRGPYARIDRDIKCFDRQWDNRVSSLKVSGQAYVQQGGKDSRYRDSDSRDYNTRDQNKRGYDGRDYDNRGRDKRDRSSAKKVNANNLARVVFNNAVLQQIKTKQWNMSSARGGVSQFKEIRRDRDSVYLQNDYTAERVRIDLFANDVTLVDRNGRQQRYNIDSKQAKIASTSGGSAGRGRIVQRLKNSIQGACFTYKAYTQGGQGGIRFYGKDGFHQFSKKSHKGRICHSGELTMEINKINPATNVIVEIQGKAFRFSQNEKPDAFKNTWYRKRHTLNVGG